MYNDSRSQKMIDHISPGRKMPPSKDNAHIPLWGQFKGKFEPYKNTYPKVFTKIRGKLANAQVVRLGWGNAVPISNLEGDSRVGDLRSAEDSTGRGYSTGELQTRGVPGPEKYRPETRCASDSNPSRSRIPPARQPHVNGFLWRASGTLELLPADLRGD